MYKIIDDKVNFLIVEKQSNVPCLRQGDSAGLSDELVLEFPELHKVKDFGFTHRLDNETLGLIIVAKSQDYYEAIRALFKEKLILKKYHARVEGLIPQAEGDIYFPIAHSKNNEKKMIAIKPGYRIYRGQPQEAKTTWKLLKNDALHSDLELTSSSGRRHQIRVHLAGIGFPICGDSLYSKNFKNYPSLMLIAKEISFKCPVENIDYTFTSLINLNNIFKDLRG